METSALGLVLFLALDVIGSVALAAWLGHRGRSASDWDRPQAQRQVHPLSSRQASLPCPQ